jgi:hypothetical protein
MFSSVEVYAASATLNWQDNSTNEDGFKVERQITAGNSRKSVR